MNIDTSNAHCGLEIPCLGAPSGREAENGMSSHSLVERHLTVPRVIILEFGNQLPF